LRPTKPHPSGQILAGLCLSAKATDLFGCARYKALTPETALRDGSSSDKLQWKGLTMRVTGDTQLKPL
jgi:hypothetical protein